MVICVLQIFRYLVLLFSSDILLSSLFGSCAKWTSFWTWFTFLRVFSLSFTSPFFFQDNYRHIGFHVIGSADSSAWFASSLFFAIRCRLIPLEPQVSFWHFRFVKLPFHGSALLLLYGQSSRLTAAGAWRESWKHWGGPVHVIYRQLRSKRFRPSWSSFKNKISFLHLLWCLQNCAGVRASLLLSHLASWSCQKPLYVSITWQSVFNEPVSFTSSLQFVSGKRFQMMA